MRAIRQLFSQFSRFNRWWQPLRRRSKVIAVAGALLGLSAIAMLLMTSAALNTEALLKVSNIETFYGPIQAIRGVSLEVHPGQIVTVLGANGAGKTTILKTISGVMDPERGQVNFDGHDIQRLSPDKVTLHQQ